MSPVLGQLARLHCEAGGALGDATELDDALGRQVDVLLDLLVDLVEQLVQGNEVRALHVPVGLLDLRLEIHGVRESRIAQRDHLTPRLLGQVVLGGVELGHVVPPAITSRPAGDASPPGLHLSHERDACLLPLTVL
jgi:hypothetical protein